MSDWCISPQRTTATSRKMTIDAASIVSGAPSTIESPASGHSSGPPPPHLNDQLSIPKPLTAAPIPPAAPITVNPVQTVGQQTTNNLSWGYDLNLLSHAADHVAREQPVSGQPGLETSTRTSPMTDQQSAPSAAAFDVTPPMLGFADIGDPVADFTVFLESVGLSNDWDAELLSTMDTSAFMPNTATTLDPGAQDPLQQPRPAVVAPALDGGQFQPISEPSAAAAPPAAPMQLIQPDLHDAEEPIPFGGPGLPKAAWDVSLQDREKFVAMLERYSHVLPRDFTPPTRHALSRFIAGYINGLNGHLPFIHVPTLSIATCSPDLSLALAAAGCHYRFEHNRGFELFNAAKCILLERIRRLDGSAVTSTPQQHTPHTLSTHWNGYHSPLYTNTSAQYRPDQSDADVRMEIIRTFLLLTVFASWERHPELLREMLVLQSTLARLVREHGLTETRPATGNQTWEQWAHDESDRRTKLLVYSFLNLHSIMYNIPPLLLTSEIKLNMPSASDEWRANTAEQWRRFYESRVTADTSFQDAFAHLFSSPTSENSSRTAVSPLGNYVLIHAILQQIFFARQLRLSVPSLRGTSLRTEDLVILDNALSAWKASWKRGPESSIDPQSSAGPIAFTSTALLGLAYIRLHLDLGPYRALMSQDPTTIATTLDRSQTVSRSPNLIKALLHSAHALSIPVRLGVDFVARTHSFFWSIQHSICSLEGAFLVSRWLLAVPATSSIQPLSGHEKKLVAWVKSMMDETDMVPDITGTQNLEFVNDPYRMKRLSVAVVRVWSKTFKGNTSWPIVDLIGSSLEIYADLLEEHH
ncbi:hypothetical protein KEM56_006870 [Ascosphaera pollenicola]|nr:hypothetical protein KEM56_006870 [Ascosphaera pollenicola]